MEVSSCFEDGDDVAESVRCGFLEADDGFGDASGGGGEASRFLGEVFGAWTEGTARSRTFSIALLVGSVVSLGP